jgi:hypothetical protein
MKVNMTFEGLSLDEAAKILSVTLAPPRADAPSEEAEKVVSGKKSRSQKAASAESAPPSAPTAESPPTTPTPTAPAAAPASTGPAVPTIEDMRAALQAMQGRTSSDKVKELIGGYGGVLKKVPEDKRAELIAKAQEAK